jgi:hypothetical protein
MIKSATSTSGSLMTIYKSTASLPESSRVSWLALWQLSQADKRPFAPHKARTL